MDQSEILELLDVVDRLPVAHGYRNAVRRGIANLIMDRDRWRDLAYALDAEITAQQHDAKVARFCRALETYQHKHLTVIKGGLDDNEK